MQQKIKLVCDCGTINQFSVERLDGNPMCGICSQPLFSGKPISVTSERLIKHIEHSGLPILIDFWAPWCGPCVNFAPLFEQFAGLVGNQLRLLKVDTEANQQAAADFNIRSIPTLSLMREGKEIARQTGGVALPQLQKWVVENLTKKY
ncbi:MAG: thioredoxin TrxC [Kangiellaceae bacterium]|nr:thioredoxin TrxC [Kangiellaceae bacterium]